MHELYVIDGMLDEGEAEDGALSRAARSSSLARRQLDASPLGGNDIDSVWRQSPCDALGQG